MDRSNPKVCTFSKMASKFSQFFDHVACMDPWQYLNPHNKMFSLFSNVHHTYSRIDDINIYVDKKLLNALENVEYSAIVESDHGPVVMDLSFNHNYTGRPQWRFNTTLLSDNSFCHLIAKSIDTFLEANTTLKAFLRGEIISYSSYRNKEEKRRNKK